MSNKGDRPLPVGKGDLGPELESGFGQSSSDIGPLIPLHAVPCFVRAVDELKALPLDPRAALLVSLMDERSTVEMILDMSGLREDDVIGILARMLELGVVEFRDAPTEKSDPGATDKFTLPDGPLPFSIESIDRHVEPNRIGAYVLHTPEEKPGDLVIVRVGRSDTDLNVRLKDYLTEPRYTEDARYDAITHFSFGYLETEESAFETECVLWHDWEPPLNDHHPGRPRGSTHGCPVFEDEDCPPCADED